MINRKTVIFVEAHIPILEVVQPGTKNVIIAKRQDILKNAVTPNLEIKENRMNSVKISLNRKQLRIQIPSKNHLLTQLT